MTGKDLNGERKTDRQADKERSKKFEVQNNAYSMHSATKTAETPSPWRILASHGLGVKGKFFRI